MKEELTRMIDRIVELRSEAFKAQNEDQYKAFGSAMRALIDARDGRKR